MCETEKSDSCYEVSGGPSYSWKPNWLEAREHLVDWWSHKGVVVGGFCWTGEEVLDPAPVPPIPVDVRQCYEDIEWRARYERATIARRGYGADLIPVTDSNIGPGSLALALGSEPGFAESTVWFEAPWRDVADVNSLPPLKFNPEAYWWQIHEAQLRRNIEPVLKALGGNGIYFMGDFMDSAEVEKAARIADRWR